MGFVDSITHTAQCSCGKVESVTILQHGSSYGASWQSGKSMENFSVTWGKEGPIGPEISQAICNSCGSVAKVSVA